MKHHYLHLSAYSCDACNGPVIAGPTTTRENEISIEIDITRWERSACRVAIVKKLRSRRASVICSRLHGNRKSGHR
jgi:hypothetical protein